LETAGPEKSGQAPPDFTIKLQRRKEMTEILILIAVVGLWYFLQAYLLPKLGIST
jgi:hypothetical protein